MHLLTLAGGTGTKMANNYGLNQLYWTIEQITKYFPDLHSRSFGGTYENANPRYLELCDLFLDDLDDKKVAWFRATWHNWTVEKDEAAGVAIAEFLATNLKHDNDTRTIG